MAQYPAVIELSGLDGTTGFQISGEAAYDGSGFSVASAGDVNGDGFDDLIIGADHADPNGSFSGASYVVFGKASGFRVNLNLSSLDGTKGFQISGEATQDYSGRSVASAGDVNGDGFDDVIIGAYRADPNGRYYSGASYVVFGHATGFAANLDLSGLDGTNGFQISGEAAFDYSGLSVAAAGDVNGDGFADLIIGANFADPHGLSSGASYVVFGKATGFAANIDLSSLDGTNGFQISGEAYDRSGISVASAGDVNGDGFADLIIGADSADPNGSFSGASYVVFGKASGFGANLDLSSLDGTNGFQISGEAAYDESGYSVASAGDVNGDGFADVIVGADHADPNGNRSGASYVVFGKASGFGANLDLASLDGTNGFQISGETADDFSGRSVASAGDVNGDGFDDIIVGAYGADANGAYSGASYVVFGQASGFSANIDLSSLDGTNGFQISGEAADDLSGLSVASAGDVNGDGLADLIVGAFGADPHGFASGASYVVFGRLPDAAVDRTGTNASQTLAGGNFDDTLSGLGGDDRLFGNGGNDRLLGGLGADVLAGGAGDDTYVLEDIHQADDMSPFVYDTVIEAARGGVDTVEVKLVFGFVPDYTLTANVENGIITGTDFFRLGGNELANHLTGNDADNTLNGGAGKDTLTGAGGNDTYVVDAKGDKVFEAVGGGTDSVRASASYALQSGQEIEALATLDAAGTAAINLSGNGFDDSLTGNAGVNQLDGKGGNDIMRGLGGDDSYFVNAAGDQVFEDAGGGSDRVFASRSYTLAAGQEIERLDTADAAGTTAINLTGNEFANIINGNAGVNGLGGGLGDDTLSGGAGADRLTGGAGRDILIGGADADTFVFLALGDSGVGSALRDNIRDFAVGTDHIDLSAIDANATAGGDQAFSFIGAGAFTGAAGQLHQVASGPNTVIEGDVNGDGAADFQILLTGALTLSAGDFVL